ncbi:Neural proliferation differentiation and control protein 1, partial [Acipenser ruthenus]
FSSQPGDKKLAQSAQMYHYQHQKQQMLSMEKHKEEPKEPGSGATSDEENEDGDFTVYECPGLAPVSGMAQYMQLTEQHSEVCFITGSRAQASQKQHCLPLISITSFLYVPLGGEGGREEPHIWPPPHCRFTSWYRDL